MEKQRVQITVEVEQDDWRKVRRFLKTLLRSFGIRCVGLNDCTENQKPESDH